MLLYQFNPWNIRASYFSDVLVYLSVTSFEYRIYILFNVYYYKMRTLLYLHINIVTVSIHIIYVFSLFIDIK